MKRAGFDPMRLDPRPLCEIMDDFIPYERWEDERAERERERRRILSRGQTRQVRTKKQ